MWDTLILSLETSTGLGVSARVCLHDMSMFTLVADFG